MTYDTKYYLTIREASDLFGIGENKLRAMIKSGHIDNNCLLKNGNRILINRKCFENYLTETEAI